VIAEADDHKTHSTRSRATGPRASAAGPAMPTKGRKPSTPVKTEMSPEEGGASIEDADLEAHDLEEKNARIASSDDDREPEVVMPAIAAKALKNSKGGAKAGTKKPRPKGDAAQPLTAREMKARALADEELAQELHDLEARGKGKQSESTVELKGHLYGLPCHCVPCEKTLITAEQIKRHFASMDHASATHAFIEQHDSDLDADERNALLSSVWFSPPKRPNPFESVGRLKKAQKVDEPTHGREPSLSKGAKGDPRHAALSPEQVRERLQRLVDTKEVSHSDTDASQLVFLLTLANIAQYADRQKKIPLPAWCVPCGADLKSEHSLLQHLSSSGHKKRLKAAMDLEFGNSSDSRGSFSPPPSSSARRDHHREIEVHCVNMNCKATLLVNRDSRTVSCYKCRLSQAVHKGR